MRKATFLEVRMEYGVEALAKLSGVSARTLHYYDEIGLLKPIARMENGRRYYGTEQFLRLQEILYFKEIGFSLRDIKSILESKNLDKNSLLNIQKEVLKKEIKRFRKMIGSIEKTIAHYKGDKMSREEICEQFDNFQKRNKELQKIYAQSFGKDLEEQVTQRVERMSKEKQEEFREQCDALMKKIVKAIERNVAPDSEEAQGLIEEQFKLSNSVAPMSKTIYLTSRDCMLENSGFYSLYEKMHPKLPGFLYEAMSVFAKHAFGSQQ